MRVYICGPMRGYPFFNFASFDHAAEVLRELGAVPINPADLSRQRVREHGFDPTVEDYMETDIQAMRDVDCIVLLPGWFNSKGAAVEIAYARYRGIPIYASLNEFEHFYHHRPKAA